MSDSCIESYSGHLDSVNPRELSGNPFLHPDMPFGQTLGKPFVFEFIRYQMEPTGWEPVSFKEANRTVFLGDLKQAGREVASSGIPNAFEVVRYQEERTGHDLMGLFVILPRAPRPVLRCYLPGCPHYQTLCETDREYTKGFHKRLLEFFESKGTQKVFLECTIGSLSSYKNYSIVGTKGYYPHM